VTHTILDERRAAEILVRRSRAELRRASRRVVLCALVCVISVSAAVILAVTAEFALASPLMLVAFTTCAATIYWNEQLLFWRGRLDYWKGRIE